MTTASLPMWAVGVFTHGPDDGRYRRAARSFSPTLQAKIDGLAGEQEKFLAELLLVVGKIRGQRGFPRVEMREDFFGQRDFGLGGLVAGARALC